MKMENSYGGDQVLLIQTSNTCNWFRFNSVNRLF